MSDKKPQPPQKIDFEAEYLKHQLAKIDRMTIQDLLATKRKQVTQIDFREKSLYIQAKQRNQQFGIKQRYVGEITPGQVWTNISEQVSDMRSADFYQQRMSRTLNYAKRGKLGIDLYLILFASVGMLTIPLYFYFVGKKDRERRVKNRKLTPQQIKNLDEDSPYSIDDVSQQVIMYYNPQRQKKRFEQMRLLHQHNKIMRQIDEM